MSYILEALRKSEKERKRDEVPTLQDVSAPHHITSAGQRASSSRLLQGLSALVLLLILVLGGMIAKKWIITGSHEQDSRQEKSRSLPVTSTAKSNQVKHQVTEQAQGKRLQSYAQTTSDSNKQKSTETSANVSLSVIREPSTSRLSPQRGNVLIFNRKDSNAVPPDGLPVTIQDDLRNMQFAGHAYSQDHALRLIMINNKILHEGDPVNADLRLFEITENGVVLLYHSKRIRINLF